MKTILKEYEAKIEIKKSTFFSFLLPYENFDKKLNFLKQNHPKAAHIVWAYRFMNEFNQVVENQTDDGEPKGTSGMPSLNVLRGVDLINAGILIVRYFGGIKLGTGGLVRAYSKATNEAINNASLINFEIKKEVIFSCLYSFNSQVEYFLKDCDFQRQFLANEVIWSLQVAKHEYLELVDFIEKNKMQGIKMIQNIDF